MMRVVLALMMLLSMGAMHARAQNVPMPVNPEVERRLAAPQSGAVTELRGYVGPGPADTVRLYTDLTLKHFYDIPQNAIVSASHPPAGSSGMSSLTVKDDAQIVFSRKSPAKQYAFASGDPSMRRPALMPGCNPNDCWADLPACALTPAGCAIFAACIAATSAACSQW